MSHRLAAFALALAAELLSGVASAQDVRSGAAAGSGGGGVSSVTAGTGLTASTNPITATGTISTNYTVSAKTSSYSVLLTDKASLLTYASSSAGTFTLPNPAAGFGVYVQNLGSGLLTLTPPSGTINGVTSLAVGINSGGLVTSDGTNYFLSMGAPPGIGEVIVANKTVTAFEWASCANLIINAASVNVTLPASTSLQASGGCLVINSIGHATTLTPATSDALNGTPGPTSATLASGSVAVVGTDGAGNIFFGGGLAAGSGSPGGSNTQVQYNNSGSFGGISGATTNGTAVTFGSGDLLGTNIALSGTAANTVQVGVSVDTIAPFVVSANTNTSPPAPSANTLIHFIGKDATAVIFQTDSYGGTPIVRYDRYDGTSSSRTALASGDGLGSFQFGGWDGTALAQPVSIIPTASENWSGTAHGASLSFSINPVTTTTSTGVMLLDGINTSVDIGAGTLAASSVAVYNVASAVDHAAFRGGTTGVGASEKCESATDTNCNLILAGQGTGIATVSGLNVSQSTGTLTIANGKTLTDNNSLTLAGTDATTMTFPAVSASVAGTNVAQSWTAGQAAAQSTPAISTSTFTPVLATSNGFKIVLVHASCPCTIANPTNIATQVGQSGVIEIDQSSTGSDTIGTWGSDYVAPGGTAAITLSTGANARDFFGYYVADSTTMVIGAGALNATH